MSEPLFTLDGCDQQTQDEYADELCDECGTGCTSSKECVELSGLYKDIDETDSQIG